MPNSRSGRAPARQQLETSTAAAQHRQAEAPGPMGGDPRGIGQGQEGHGALLHALRALNYFSKFMAKWVELHQSCE